MSEGDVRIVWCLGVPYTRESIDPTAGCKGSGGELGWPDSAGFHKLGRSVRGVRIGLDDGVLRGGLASHFDCSRACGLAPSKKIDGVTLRIAASKEPQFWERKPMGFAAGGLGVSPRAPRGSIVPNSSRGPL